jgi:hypothetical protein
VRARPREAMNAAEFIVTSDQAFLFVEAGSH